LLFLVYFLLGNFVLFSLSSLNSSYPRQKAAENATEAAPLRSLRLHRLRIFDQPDRS
jgi:hypothetical protein